MRLPRVGRYPLPFLVLALVVAAGCEGESDTLGQANKASAAQAVGILEGASEAEDEYFSQNGSYTNDPRLLVTTGLRIPAAIKLSIPRADGSEFCIEAASGITRTTSWHVSSEQSLAVAGACPR
jgi:hypothetical protein